MHSQGLHIFQQTNLYLRLAALYSRLATHRRCRSHPKTRQSRFLQLPVPGPKTRQPTNTYPPSVAEIPQVLPQRCHLSVYQPRLRSGHVTFDFHQHGKGSQTRHSNPPIPGRLVRLRPLQRGVQQTDTETVKPSKGFGLCSEPQEIKAGT